MDVGRCIVPWGLLPVGYAVYELIASTFMGRLSSGGCLIGLSSVGVKCRWMDLPCRRISGR